jgi:hypothetical protein
MLSLMDYPKTIIETPKYIRDVCYTVKNYRNFRTIFSKFEPYRKIDPSIILQYIGPLTTNFELKIYTNFDYDYIHFNYADNSFERLVNCLTADGDKWVYMNKLKKILS